MCHHHIEGEALREYMTEPETEDLNEAEPEPEPEPVAQPADD
ncbi:MAG: hypothetical protein ABEH88_04365 [Halobacteriales archaeon]